MEGYKIYGRFTILSWRTWQERYRKFREDLKRPPNIVVFDKRTKSLNRILRELHNFFHKIWNYVPTLPEFIAVPLFNSEMWYYVSKEWWYAFEPLLARFLNIQRIIL